MKCKHYTRREAYNQQWGMVQFYNNSCNKGHNGEINSYFDGVECNDFEHGENTLVCMSDKEKRKLGVYIPNNKTSECQLHNNKDITDLLEDIGVKMEKDNTYKSTHEIIKEISGIFNQLK